MIVGAEVQEAALAVLIIEDNIYAADLNIRMLRKEGFEVCHQIAREEEEMTQNLTNRKWDVILSDHSIPSFNALKALEVRNQLSPSTPFIIVTEQMGERERNEAFNRGCSGFVAKEHLSDLGKIIKYTLWQT